MWCCWISLGNNRLHAASGGSLCINGVSSRIRVSGLPAPDQLPSSRQSTIGQQLDSGRYSNMQKDLRSRSSFARNLATTGRWGVLIPVVLCCLPFTVGAQTIPNGAAIDAEV